MKKDLFVLVADKNMEGAFNGILSRHHSLGISPISYAVQTHSARDSGVRKTGAELLRTQIGLFRHALMVYDFEGAGREEIPAGQLEEEGDKRLRQSGWEDRARTLVIQPELDIWIWIDSPHVTMRLGWRKDYASLRQWLTTHGYKFNRKKKPVQPKEAMEAVLRMNRIPRSSALYKRIAQNAGFTKCTDRAFVKLREILNSWFSNK